jgi:CHAT domain-containing protein/tetratricopeptide (TPR) repeat protein
MEALEASTEAVQLAQRLRNTKGLIVSLRNRAQILRQLGQHTEKPHFLRASAKDLAWALDLAASLPEGHSDAAMQISALLVHSLVDCYLQREDELSNSERDEVAKRFSDWSTRLDPEEVVRLVANFELEPDGYLRAARGIMENLLTGATPEVVRDLGFRLGDALAVTGRWADACHYFKRCAASYQKTRAEADSETWTRGDDDGFRIAARWASYSAAMSGRREEAIGLLESGLAAHLRSLVDGEVPRPRNADPRHPLVYFICSLWGTIVLVDRGAGNEVGLVQSSVTSENVAELVTGFRLHDGVPTEYPGLLVASSYDEIRRALDECSEIFGSRMLESLVDELAVSGAVDATIVRTGFLSYIPIHLMFFAYQGIKRYLWEVVDISYLPTAWLGRPHEFATRNLPERLVAIAGGDSAGDLFVGAREISMLEEVAGREAVRLNGQQDLKLRLRDALSVPCDLHISAHGTALSEHLDGAVLNIDAETISFKDLASLNIAVGVRVGVLAACSSGFQDPVAALDEALSLQAGLLAAGAGGVVAANWPVNDRASYLLFGRFYTNLYRHGMTGRVALREAALWMRQLSDSEAQRLLAAKSVPDFENVPSLLRQVGSGVSPAEPPLVVEGDELGALSHPYFWGAFSYWGFCP